MMRIIKIVGILSLFVSIGLCKASSRATSQLTRPGLGSAGRFNAQAARPFLGARAGIGQRLLSTTPENKKLLPPDWEAGREKRKKDWDKFKEDWESGGRAKSEERIAEYRASILKTA